MDCDMGDTGHVSLWSRNCKVLILLTNIKVSRVHLGQFGSDQGVVTWLCLCFSFWLLQRTKALSILLFRFWKIFQNHPGNTVRYSCLLNGLLHLKHHALPVWSCHNRLQIVLINRANAWAPFPPLTWHPGTLPLAPLVGRHPGDPLSVPSPHLPLPLTRELPHQRNRYSLRNITES